MYHEPGASGWALTWGPLFALAGWFAEWVNGLRPHTPAWLLAGTALLVLSALWVYARRRFLSVRVADGALWQGGERLPVDRIVEIDGDRAGEDPPGREPGTDGRPPGRARVLGGGPSVPRKYAEVPLCLDDGTVVLAWARDGDALRRALAAAMREGRS